MHSTQNNVDIGASESDRRSKLSEGPKFPMMKCLVTAQDFTHCFYCWERVQEIFEKAVTFSRNFPSSFQPTRPNICTTRDTIADASSYHMETHNIAICQIQCSVGVAFNSAPEARHPVPVKQAQQQTLSNRIILDFPITSETLVCKALRVAHGRGTWTWCSTWSKRHPCYLRAPRRTMIKL